jgi:hypothetical protein
MGVDGAAVVGWSEWRGGGGVCGGVFVAAVVVHDETFHVVNAQRIGRWQQCQEVLSAAPLMAPLRPHQPDGAERAIT